MKALISAVVLVGLAVLVWAQTDTGGFDSTQQAAVSATSFRVTGVDFFRERQEFRARISIQYLDAQGAVVAMPGRSDNVTVDAATFLAGTGVTPAQFYTRARNVAKNALQQ